MIRRFELVGWGVCLFLIIGIVAPPITEKKKKDQEDSEDNEIDQPGFDVEYKRYLQEVVNVLESDDEFRERVAKADPEDVKSGKIATDLEFVSHNVRSKLDELKRQELERLRQAAIRHYEESNGIDKKHMKIPSHIDHSNPHTFESEDLKKLIVQTTKELDEADRQRKQEFKEYEMRKELEYEEQLKLMDDKSRAEAENHHKKMLEKHRVSMNDIKDHKPIHHPGSKQQLEEVWEEQDQLSPEDFNPKTFFHLHDLDGNGVWDVNEVKALFKKELDKMYDANATEDDIRERFEEMERMREHVFNETDTNRDLLISFQEFLDQTTKQDFEKDEGWEPIDQEKNPVYTEDEFKQYAQQHEEEIRHQIEQGMAQGSRPDPGYHPEADHQNQNDPAAPQRFEQQHHDQQQQHHNAQQHQQQIAISSSEHNQIPTNNNDDQPPVYQQTDHQQQEQQHQAPAAQDHQDANAHAFQQQHQNPASHPPPSAKLDIGVVPVLHQQASKENSID